MAHRILFVNPVGVIGGAERSLLELIAALDRSRYEPVAALFESGAFQAELEGMGVETVVIAVSSATQSLSLRGVRPSLASAAVGALAAGGAMMRLARVIRRRRISLVHTNGLKAQMIAGVAAGLTRRPVVWHLRDLIGTGGHERAILTAGSRLANVIVANSHATRAAVEQRVSCPVVTVHNGVNLNAFTPDVGATAFRHELGIDGEMLVGMVAMLTPWKGHDVFLNAAQRVRAAHPGVRFVIVGDEIYSTAGHGGYRDRLEQLAQSLGLGDRVMFAGYRNNMPEVMAGLDLLVHASVQPEPFGRVLIEAMACGKAVIAAEGGGVKEIVNTGETGLLVQPGDIEALAAAINDLIAAPAKRTAMGRNGRQRVVQAFSADRHAAAIQDIYDMTLTPAA